MNEDTANIITILIMVGLIIFGSFGAYYYYKWTGEDVKIMRDECKKQNMELTDYRFGDGWKRINAIGGDYYKKTVSYECDNKVMDIPIYLEKRNRCIKSNKWGDCIERKEIILKGRFVNG